MISRVIIKTDPGAVTQRAWDDFCHDQGLVLRPTGYFAANGLHAGCEGTRVSFFSRSAERTNRLAACFLLRFGGEVASQVPVLTAAGALMADMNWDTSYWSPEDFTVEGIVEMLQEPGDTERQVAVTDHAGNDLRVLSVRERDYRVEIVTDQPGREPYVQDDTAEDDRPYPKGEATDTRLDRWIRDHVADRRIRRDGIDPVTMTGREITELLMQVAEWSYDKARIDVDSAVKPLPWMK